jgi:prevent-host-death family protein
MYIIITLEGDDIMSTVNATNARKNLFQLISDVNEYSDPVTITNSKGKNAVLISEDDWKCIEETIMLNSIPGLAESIIEGGQEPLSTCKVYIEDEEW